MVEPLLPLPNLKRTADALDRRDREVPALWAKIDELLDAGTLTNEQFWEIHAEIEKIEESVGIAFGQDTADRNDPETCRKCVRAGEPLMGDRGDSKVRRWVYAWRLTQTFGE